MRPQRPFVGPCEVGEQRLIAYQASSPPVAPGFRRAPRPGTSFEHSAGCGILVIGYGVSHLTGIRLHSVVSQSGWTLSAADCDFRVAQPQADEREQFGGIHG